MVVLRFGPFECEPATGRLYRGANQIPLSSAQMAILRELVLHRGEVASNAALMGTSQRLTPPLHRICAAHRRTTPSPLYYSRVIEIPHLHAVEQQLEAAKFSTMLAVDENIGRVCMTLFCGPPAPGEPAGEMFDLAREAWTHLAAAVLPCASTYAWDTDATQHIEVMSDGLGPDAVLDPATVPAPIGWWWLGPAFRLFREFGLCALAWDENEHGVMLYPFRIVEGRWGPGFEFEGEPYRLGPMTIGGMPVQYGISLAQADEYWREEVPGNHAKLSALTRFFIAACETLGRQLTVQTTAIPRHDRKRLQRRFPNHRLSGQVQVVRLRAQPSAVRGASC